MKKKCFCGFVCLLMLLSCESELDKMTICPDPSHLVFTFFVDYTTNNFLGGYQVELKNSFDSLVMACDYKSPGDFGDVTWYNKTDDTKLFAGTIVWMGKGRCTYPEKIREPSSFNALAQNHITAMPTFKRLYHNEFHNDIDEDVNYNPIWKPLESLQDVSWLMPNSPAYIYLYCPSVGFGDPKDWYWVIFLDYYAY